MIRGPGLTRTTVALAAGALLRLVESDRQARLEEVDAATHVVRTVAAGVTRSQLRTPARLWVEARGLGDEWPKIAAGLGWFDPPPGATELAGEIACAHGSVSGDRCARCEEELPPALRRR